MMLDYFMVPSYEKDEMQVIFMDLTFSLHTLFTSPLHGTRN